MPERGALVRTAAVRGEQIRRGEDRVACVVHIAAHSVPSPRRRLELHRTLGVRAGGRARAAEVGLGEVDRREQLPADAEPPLSRAIEGKEHARMTGGADGYPARLRRALGGEPEQIAPRGEVVPFPGREPQDRRGHSRVAAERKDKVLTVAGKPDEARACRGPQRRLVDAEVADDRRWWRQQRGHVEWSSTAGLTQQRGHGSAGPVPDRRLSGERRFLG